MSEVHKEEFIDPAKKQSRIANVLNNVRHESKRLVAVGSMGAVAVMGVLGLERSLQTDAANAQPVAALEAQPYPYHQGMASYLDGDPGATPAPTPTWEEETPTPTPSPVPTPTELPNPAATADPSQEYKGSGMTLGEVCRGAALGALSGVGIEIRRVPKRKGKQELVWRYSNNEMPDDCKYIGKWAVKLSLNKKLDKRVKPFTIKNGRKVRVKSVIIPNPTSDHGTYSKVIRLKRRFPSVGHANDPDRDDTMWTPNGGPTEVRHHSALATVVYRK